MNTNGYFKNFLNDLKYFISDPKKAIVIGATAATMAFAPLNAYAQNLGVNTDSLKLKQTKTFVIPGSNILTQPDTNPDKKYSIRKDGYQIIPSTHDMIDSTAVKKHAEQKKSTKE